MYWAGIVDSYDLLLGMGLRGVLDWTGLDWTGLDWTGLDWTGLDGAALGLVVKEEGGCLL